MLYSIGKDSSVMLRLAEKAFYPDRIPFPLLHIDTGYKFREMIQFRDALCRESGLDLIVHRNEDAIQSGANPFQLGTKRCCELLKTQALLQALRKYGIDAAIGGARRDEKSRERKSEYSRSGIPTANGILRISALKCGISTTGGSGRTRASASFRCQIGPSWTYGNTSRGRTFR